MISKDLAISSNYESLRGVSEVVHNFLMVTCCSEDEIGLCDLVIQELLANLVEHAYQCDPSKSINLHLGFEKNILYIETEDYGPEVDMDLDMVNMPDPEKLQVGGYGLAIIKFLADKVEYIRENGKNIWRIEKNICVKSSTPQETG